MNLRFKSFMISAEKLESLEPMDRDYAGALDYFDGFKRLKDEDGYLVYVAVNSEEYLKHLGFIERSANNEIQSEAD